MATSVDSLIAGTFLLLALAALIFVWQIARVRRAGRGVSPSFPSFLLAMIVGWAGTEIIADFGQAQLGRLGEIGHFLVMGAFAVVITIHLRRSLRSG